MIREEQIWKIIYGKLIEYYGERNVSVDYKNGCVIYADDEDSGCGYKVTIEMTT